MKQLFAVTISLIVSIVSYGQISVSQQKTIGVVKNGMAEDVVLYTNGKVITIKYMGVTSDNRWNVNVIKFDGGDNELNILYDSFISVFDNPDKNHSVDLTLGDNNFLTLSKSKVVGISYVTISNGNTTTRPLNKIQINKLFGK